MSGTVETAIEIRPFQVDIPDEALDDLRRRIAATNWPEKETVADHSQGVPLAVIQKLARYWMTDYDWRTCEANLNALPQFVTEIDGLDIHFIHVRSQHEDALPLIVNHGWPGSIIEQLKIVDRLTDPTAHGGERSGRVPCGDSVDAGLRVLGEADEHRLGPRAHGSSLGRADDSASATAATSPRAATGARSSSTRWACRHLRDCSRSTPTCLPRFRPTSTRLPWPASRRRPVSRRRNDVPTSS